MDFEQLKKLLAPRPDNTIAAAKQAADRIKMMNPNMQGPHLPDQTPEEEQYYEDLTGAVTGTISPIKKAPVSIADLNSPSRVAKGIADVLAEMNVNPEAVAKGQQGLSRAVDFEQRNKEGLRAAQAARRAALKKLSGE